MTDGTGNDEFGSLGEVAAELGLEQTAIKPVARHSVEVDGRQQVSVCLEARPSQSWCSCTAAGRTRTPGTW